MTDTDGGNMPNSPESPSSPTTGSRPRRPSVASRISYKVRSLSKDFEESNPPPGFMAATSEFASSAVARGSRRNSSSSINHPPPRRRTLSDQTNEQAPRESAEFQQDRRSEKSGNQTPADRIDVTAVPSGSRDKDGARTVRTAPQEAVASVSKEKSQDSETATDPFDNGYHFPPSYPKGEAFKHGLIAFLRYSITPIGFFVVLYGLNVVAWGGMLFLLLCNASPAMCYPDCNDINSPRRVWIEYDSQILTALFSLTAFGLAPWRFRDLYYLMKYRLIGRQAALRQLGGIHRDWFRLSGSSALPIDVGPENIEGLLAEGKVAEGSVPLPAKKIPEAPLTGVRAPPTKAWKMDFVIWLMIWNTLFQCVLSGVMWGMNRYTRPSWSTGLFVALGCIVAGVGGIMMFIEGRHVKSIEGVPLTDRDRERLARDQERGIPHYNNIKDKPLDKKEKKEKKKEEATP